MFFFTWCSVDKFSPHIPAHHLGPYRFMTNKIFVKEFKIKVEFSELSQEVFTKIKQFWKFLSIENSILLKGLKRPNTNSSKIDGFLDVFRIIYKFTWAIRTLTCGLTSGVSGRWVEGAEWVWLQIWVVCIAL